MVIPMKHTMKTVMVALQAARVDGKGLPMLTSNQCHALAQELNKQTEPALVECDACPRSTGCVETCMKAPAP